VRPPPTQSEAVGLVRAKNHRLLTMSGFRLEVAARVGNLTSSAARVKYIAAAMPAAKSVRLPSLAYWRIQRGVTREQLAGRIVMLEPTVARIEAGHPALVRTTRLLASFRCKTGQ
jgi:hypothetical protein